MIQREFAEKISIKNNKLNKYNFLVNLYSDYRICFNVSKNVFIPKPKINSSVVKLEFKESNYDWEKINNFCNSVFANKRKKIKNCLSLSDFDTVKYKTKDLYLEKRAEDLSQIELFEIYNSL